MAEQSRACQGSGFQWALDAWGFHVKLVSDTRGILLLQQEKEKQD